MMWVPPSLPYYELSGAIREKHFPKYWFLVVEMVPRMIACLLLTRRSENRWAAHSANRGNQKHALF